MKKYLLYIIITICSTYVFGQNVFTGQVIDSVTREPIADATIIQKGTVSGTSSDSMGFFKVFYYSINSPTFVVTHVAYKNYPFWINAPGKNEGKIEMTREEYLVGSLNLNPRKLKKRKKSLNCNVESFERFTPDSNFTVLESMFQYPGGNECLDLLFIKHFLPQIENNTIEPFGKLRIDFKINEQGQPIDMTLSKEVDDNVATIIDDIFKDMLTWTPSRQREKNILTDVYYILEFE